MKLCWALALFFTISSAAAEENQSAQMAFNEAVAFHAKAGASRIEAAHRFVALARLYPSDEKGILSAKYAVLLEKAAKDPLLAQPEPSGREASMRWRVHRLQEQEQEWHMSHGGHSFHSGDSPFAKVEELGVAAIPALLEMEGEERLCRWYHPHGDSGASSVGTLEEMVPILLFQICGERPANFAELRKWWATANQRGVAQTLAERISRGETVHYVRHLAALDPQLAARALMQATQNARERDTRENALSELHARLKGSPDLETSALARQMLAKPPGSIPWCAGITVLGKSSDRSSVRQAAAREWQQPSGMPSRLEMRCLARVLIWSNSVDVLESSWAVASPERKLAILEGLSHLGFVYVAVFAKRSQLMELTTEQQVLHLLDQVSGDKTKIPDCGKIPYTLMNTDAQNPEKTLGERSRHIAETIRNLRKNPERDY